MKAPSLSTQQTLQGNEHGNRQATITKSLWPENTSALDIASLTSTVTCIYKQSQNASTCMDRACRLRVELLI